MPLTISRRDLRAFSRPVADLIIHLVNDHDVRHRMTDGGHVLLYGPNRTSRKISRSRKEQDSITHLTKWARELGCDHL